LIRTALALVLLATLVACGSPAPSSPDRPLPPAPPPPPMADERRVCAADVQACPDGSYVSRNPASGCAFDRCPAEKNKTLNKADKRTGADACADLLSSCPPCKSFF
jgi:hypothetical protein